MKATIETVDNGYIVTVPNPNDEGTITLVFEEEDGTFESYSHGDCPSEVDNFIKVLWSLNEYIGPSTSRYASKRVNIDSEPGDKHEDYADLTDDTDLLSKHGADSGLSIEDNS
jgi:hypothetical protein